MLKNSINLEQNGIIFPNWVMANFKKYILPEIINKDGVDPCNEKRVEEVTTYQKFVGQYLNFQSPFKDMLIYHGVVAGKTNTVINLYNLLFNYTSNWNIFILIPAALHDDPWVKDLSKWMIKKDYDKRLSNIIFIHYDSPFADADFLEKVKKADSSKTSMFVIDEAHRFIGNVYNNIYSKKGKRAQVIYDYIQQEKKENYNTRIVLLSATPIVNLAFEFALIFNLLRPDTFPTSEALFEQLYISSTNFTSLNENTKNLFQRRILGLVSYYIGATPDKYAQKTIHYVNLTMDKYQEEIYNHFEKIEEHKEKIRLQMSRGKVGNDEGSTYLAYTRQSCNFVFPNINSKVYGEGRPRPSHFKVRDEDAEIIDLGKNLDKRNKLVKNKEEVLLYVKAIHLYINSFIEYLKDILRKDKETKYTLSDDINKFYKNYNGSFTDFMINEKNKSNLFNALYKSSPKFINIIFNILKTKGTVLIYSNYVEMEGLQLLKIYLNFFNFISLDDDTSFNKTSLKNDGKHDFHRYIEYHGSIDTEVRKINKSIFNQPINMYGKNIKIIMISPAGAEGLNLYNVRQVHILEPYWHEVRIEQVIGRALRYCHHKDLPQEERKVDIFRYKMVRTSGKETTDEKMENLSRKKNTVLLSFIEAVKEAAVDCELFKNHNMMGSKYKCFQFNEDILLDVPLRPAYQKNLDYDMKMDNGLNSKNSTIKKIKVRKIQAVIKSAESDTYSQEAYYWLFEETGTVYDYELYYPVGKLEKDNNNNFNMIDNKIYIIGQIIQIPSYTLYE
jgi:superfamily II DNA or RNA helicase